jgi:predicted RNase H-like nuclease (RuvC/YqgF family)
MTVNGRRTLRLFFKFGLLVSLPLAGYLWAITGNSPWTIGVGSACVVMALAAEALATVSESRLSQLKALANTEDRAYETEVATREEKIRQMDRVVETLSNQNHDLRSKLVSLHGEVHHLHEETAHLGLDVEADAGSEPQAGEQAAGEVTDITSLIKR